MITYYEKVTRKSQVWSYTALLNLSPYCGLMWHWVSPYESCCILCRTKYSEEKCSDFTVKHSFLSRTQQACGAWGSVCRTYADLAVQGSQQQNGRVSFPDLLLFFGLNSSFFYIFILFPSLFTFLCLLLQHKCRTQQPLHVNNVHLTQPHGCSCLQNGTANSILLSINSHQQICLSFSNFTFPYLFVVMLMATVSEVQYVYQKDAYSINIALGNFR